jgi:hypothetical protein
MIKPDFPKKGMVVVTAIPFFVFDTFETPGGGPSFRLKLREAGHPFV